MSQSSAQAPEELESEPTVLSQRDYKPTPYRETHWEIVGESVAERDFVALEVSVLQGNAAEPDPMFEIFGQGYSKDTESVYHGPFGRPKHVPGGIDEISEAEQMAQLEALLEERYQEGLKEGHALGVADGQAKVAEKYEELSNHVTEVLTSVVNEVSEVVARMETQALELALDIAKRILTTTVDVRPDYILDVIRAALKSLGAAKPLRIRVSLDDFEFLNVVGLPPELSSEELGVSYVADESVKSGCVVETNFGEVDMVVEKMWEQIRDSLYEVKG